MIAIEAGYCKGCSICILVCPKDVLVESKEVNSRGYFVPAIVDEEECTDCHQCELFCPDFAIFVIEESNGANG